jgi:hypothetical protein
MRFPNYASISFGFEILGVLIKAYIWVVVVGLFLAWVALRAIFPYPQAILVGLMVFAVFGLPIIFGIMAMWYSRRGRRAVNAHFASMKSDS